MKSIFGLATTFGISFIFSFFMVTSEERSETASSVISGIFVFFAGLQGMISGAKF